MKAGTGAWFGALALAMLSVAPLRAAEPQPADAVIIVAPSRAPVSLGAAELSALPSKQVAVSFATEQGTLTGSFEGPLLWSVLEKAGAIDPAKHRDQVSQTVVILARDGYRAVLALAEIAPEFEAKQVILAVRADGKPLGAGHPRLIVPLDKRGGRSVRDVVRIELVGLADTK